MRKKNASKILTAMLLSLFAATMLSKAISPVNAQTKPTLKIEPDFYFAQRLNEEFDVNVTISNIEASMRLIAIHFRLYYNNTLLQVVSATEGDFLPRFNQTSEPPATLFVWATESDGIFGPHIVVGDFIFPNSTGQWPGPFPEGSGVVATIRFKVIYRPVEPDPIAACVLRFIEVILLTDEGGELEYATGISLYQSPVPLRYPTPKFTYSPTYPMAGQTVVFNASQSSDPDGTIVSYVWDFGDGTTLTISDKACTHIFAQPKTYNVTLSVIDSDGLEASTWKTVDIGAYTPVEINVESGEIYYPGETAEFYITTSQLGKPINVVFNALDLYYGGSLYANLSGSVQTVADGLYLVQYTIPDDADTGVYMLFIEAEYSSVTGIGTASFQISDLFDDIKATIVGINGTVVYINSTLGTLVRTVGDINASLVRVEGTVAYINSTVGSLVTPIQNINLTVTEIKENVAFIQTTLGTIKGYLENVDDGGLATINTEIGLVKTNISTLLQRVPETLPTVDPTPSWIAAAFAILAFVAAIFLIIKQK